MLSNPKAPLQSVGINLGPGGYVDYVTGATTTPSAEHWLWNNQYQAIAAGNPFPGVGRNVLRGDSWSDLDLSASKTFKVAERVNVQIMASAFNVMNRAYYASPDLNSIWPWSRYLAGHRATALKIIKDDLGDDVANLLI